MPRDVYYQDHGNPIQRDRLPETTPQVAPMFLRQTDHESRMQAVFAVGGMVLRLLLIFFACFAGRITDEVSGVPVAASVLCLLAVCYSLRALISSDDTYRWVSLFSMAGAILLFVERQLPVFVLLLLAAVTIGVLVWLFGTHWGTVCTAPPMKAAQARTLQQQWQPTLALTAAIPAAVLILATLLDSLLVGVLPLGVLAVAQLRNLPKPQLLWDVLTAWCRDSGLRAVHPGIATNLTSSCQKRLALSTLSMVIVATSWIRASQDWQWSASGGSGTEAAALVDQLRPNEAARPEEILATASVFGFAGLGPLLAVIGLPLLLSLPVLAEAAEHRPSGVDASNWHDFIDTVQHSPDQIERRSYYMGQVASDGMPVLIPRKVFNNHAHFLGDSGGGKTSLGLAPWIEQTVGFGDCSVIVVDLKADSLELLATLQSAADALQRRTGRQLPLKCFSNQSKLPTYAFNPLTQPYWHDFDPYVKTDILCGAAGLIYGTHYGAGWYSAANAAVLHYAIKRFPDVSTFEELAQRVNDTVTRAKKSDLHSELRSSGVHVQAVMDRLGSFDALNVQPGGRYDDDILREAIDLTDVFRRPQLLYFHLSSTLGPGSSPEIARFLVYSLLAASTQTERRHQVYLVIDEFQRMASHNVEYMLQLARSMGVGIVLANQSMDDLGDLITPVEANCRVQQWFSVSSDQDRQRISRKSGEMIETFEDITRTRNGGGKVSVSQRMSQQVMPRLSPNDIALASDMDMQSILTITRGDGYAQFGGLPFIAQSTYHITETEYERRKSTAWPARTTGMFVPRDARKVAPMTPSRSHPTITAEVIGEFDFGQVPQPRKPRRRGQRRRHDQGEDS